MDRPSSFERKIADLVKGSHGVFVGSTYHTNTSSITVASSIGDVYPIVSLSDVVYGCPLSMEFGKKGLEVLHVKKAFQFAPIKFRYDTSPEETSITARYKHPKDLYSFRLNIIRAAKRKLSNLLFMSSS